MLNEVDDLNDEYNGINDLPNFDDYDFNDKDFHRLTYIFYKSQGTSSIIDLAKNMADRISTYKKAIQRGKAAIYLAKNKSVQEKYLLDEVARIFFKRAFNIYKSDKII